MFDSAKVAKEIFSTLRSFNYEVAAFDEEGNKVYEPESATRFFTDKKNITVSLDSDGENSFLRIILGRSVPIPSVQGLLDTLRRSATKFGINYNVRKYRRDFAPKDFAFSTVLESKSLSGSKKSSYLKLEGARMIIRHDAIVDDSKHGARGRNVKKVMIENNDGERFLMPSTNLMAGRAMTRHISKGGHWSDDIGTRIAEMARAQKHMKTCASYCRKNKNKLDEDALQIGEACRDHARHFRATFEGLYRNYDKKNEEILKEPETLLVEDEEALNERVVALQKKLQLEDESVMDRSACESVARVIESLAPAEETTEMQALPALDAKVEKSAWGAFKNENKLNLSDAVDFPEDADDTERLKLIADKVTDKGMSAMLKSVAEKIEAGDSSALLVKIAHSALNADLVVPEQSSDVVEEETMIPLPMLGGIKVEAKAWEDLKDGKMAISHPLEFPIPSTSTNKTVSQLRAVAGVCAYNGLSDVLERVADDIDLGRAQPIHQKIAQNAIAACIAASRAQPALGKELALHEKVIMTTEVRDFGAWLDSLTPNSIITESLYDDPMPRDAGRMSDDEYENHLSQSIADAVDDFDAEDFLVTNGDDFGYGDPSDPDLKIAAQDILSSLTFYLGRQVDSNLSGSVHAADDNFGDLAPQAKGLLSDVIGKLEEEGYTVTGQETIEGDDINDLDVNTDPEFSGDLLDETGDRPRIRTGREIEAEKEKEEFRNTPFQKAVHKVRPTLEDDEPDADDEGVSDDGLDSNKELLLGSVDDDIAPEDVLIPTNPQTDFEKEVTIDADPDEIDRLLALAGQRRSEQPNQRPVRP